MTFPRPGHPPSWRPREGDSSASIRGRGHLQSSECLAMTGSLSESEMTAHDVCGFLDLMDAYGTRVWLDGGWALDPALAPSRGVTATSTSLSRSAMCRWPSRFSKVASMPRAPSRHPRMELRPRRRRRAPDRLPRHHARRARTRRVRTVRERGILSLRGPDRKGHRERPHCELHHTV